MSDNHMKIDVSKIPPIEKELLCTTIFEACKKFYSDPENVKKYEKWKAVRDAKESEKTRCKNV